MLKTTMNDQLWLVTQPDHGQLAGDLAARWGNDAFRPLGGYAPVPDPARLRDEAIFAIAQHDNGWFEWEADPGLSDSDRLPVDLSDMVRDQEDGMNRWRLGLRRFPRAPYANLLISEHPRMMYELRRTKSPAAESIHPLFWKERPEPLLPGSVEAVGRFIDELLGLQAGWKADLAADPRTRDWLEPGVLRPHARMLQVLDGLSLALTSSLIPAARGSSLGLGRDAFELREVPRTGWDDRVTIDVRPVAANFLVLDPFPFDLDPLPVRVPVRVFDADGAARDSYRSRWHASPPRLLEYWLGSSARAFDRIR